MRLWVVSMECAGIVEAGGVKNVTYSLCKEFSRAGHDVTLFIPVFKSSSFELIRDYSEENQIEFPIAHCSKTELVRIAPAICVLPECSFSVIFVNHPSFSGKEDVYTYTENEQAQNPEHVKGSGHKDTLFMDSLFAKAVAAYAEQLEDQFLPDIVHCQDASTALLPAYMHLDKRLSAVNTVVTIHNAGPAYHHNFSSLGEAAWYTSVPEELLYSALNNERVEPFLLASSCGAHLTTVSENYAQELTEPGRAAETEGLSAIFCQRKIPITGITNGIDFERYDPSDRTKSLLPFEFCPERGELSGKWECRRFLVESMCSGDRGLNIPHVRRSGFLAVEDMASGVFVSYHGRITQQKGISVLIQSIPAIISNFPNVYFIIMGQGELRFEDELRLLTERFKGRVVFFNGYERELARLSNAAGDFIVLPSFFEPCGLEDFIAQLFGTLPVANSTGGLNKIVDGKTGFLYRDNSPETLIAKLSEVITIKLHDSSLVSRMIREAAVFVRRNYLWENVIRTRYFPFFKEICKKS